MIEVQDQVPLVFSSLNLFVVDLNYSVIVVHTDQTNLSLSLSLSLSLTLSLTLSLSPSPSSDALPVALQSPGKAAAAEVVCDHSGAREEEGHPRYDLHGAGTEATLLQLPPLERPEDCLQEVSPQLAHSPPSQRPSSPLPHCS